MNPVFVVEPIAWNYDDDVPAKTVDEHLATKPNDLVDSWGTAGASVDLEFLSDDPVTATGEHPLEWITREARALGLPLLPTVSIGRTPPYVAAATQVVNRDGEGATVRLPLTEWPISTGGPAALAGLLGTLGLAPDSVDLILDLGDEVAAAPGIALTAVQGQLATLPNLLDWRSLTVAGSDFPKTLAGLPRGVTALDRHEWILHTAVVGTAPPRVPMFGDYAIAHPDPSVDVNPAWMSISAALRYTVDTQWLVAKGELFKGQGGSGLGGSAMGPVAAALAARPEWMGAGHCEMEDWVHAVIGGASGGNPEAWRKFGTHHHLQHAVDQLATLGVP